MTTDPWTVPIRLEDLPERAMTWPKGPSGYEDSGLVQEIEKLTGGSLPDRTLNILKRIGGRKIIWPVFYIPDGARDDYDYWPVTVTVEAPSALRDIDNLAWDKQFNYRVPVFGGLNLYWLGVASDSKGQINQEDVLGLGDDFGESIGMPADEDYFLDNLYLYWKYVMLDKPGDEEAIKAAASGRLDLVRQFLDEDHWIDGAVNDRGRTLLFYAASNNQVETVRWLIEQGADPDHSINAEDDNKGATTTLAYLARMSICCDAAETLLEAGANVNRITEDDMKQVRSGSGWCDRFTKLLESYGWHE